MIAYSKKNLEYAYRYMQSLKEGSAAHTFCSIPLALAAATVQII